MVGFVGNEAVALFQIRTGKRIGSEALVADGLHARIDGLTSLVVLAAVAGSALGYPIVDPIIGLLIGAAIVFIARDAARRIWYRLMDAVDPQIVERIEQYAGDVPGVAQVARVRARWIGHELHAEVAVILAANVVPGRVLQITAAVRHALRSYVPHLYQVAVEVITAVRDEEAVNTIPTARREARGILPPRYQDPKVTVSAAPMGAAALRYGSDGKVAWNEMWTGYCELALAGGAPHRGSLLEPVESDAITADPEGYERVLGELERGLRLVTDDLPVRRNATLGWIGLECRDEEMALWLLRAIVVENVTVRRENATLWLPAGPDFRLEREIKNVVTVVAKTYHYWVEHAAALQR